jgi:hypothetical protein
MEIFIPLPAQDFMKKFHNYLASIGVTKEFMIMVEYMYWDKEQREYEHWLKSIRSFLDK